VSAILSVVYQAGVSKETGGIYSIKMRSWTSDKNSSFGF